MEQQQPQGEPKAQAKGWALHTEAMQRILEREAQRRMAYGYTRDL